MRAFSKLALSVGLAAVLSTPALAQQRGGFGMGASGAMLLGNEGVQKELKLTDDQSSKVKDLVEDTREKQQEAFGKLQDVPQEERREKAMEAMRSINADMRKSLSSILKDDQLKRFNQIELQQRGADALTDNEVQAKLKLDDTQKQKVQAVLEDSRSQMRELFQPGGDRQEMMKKMTDLRKDTNDKAMAILTSEQKATWKEMTGEPFQVQFQRPGGGAGGRNR